MQTNETTNHDSRNCDKFGHMGVRKCICLDFYVMQFRIMYNAEH